MSLLKLRGIAAGAVIGARRAAALTFFANRVAGLQGAMFAADNSLP